MKEFVSKHPGGSSWLILTRGQDITDYYETHHIDREKADKILAKYYVCDQPSSNVYEFRTDNLYGKIKSKVLKLYRDGQLSDPPAITYLFSTLWVILWILNLCWVVMSPSLISVLPYSYILYVMIGVGHNYCHRNSRWRYALDLTGYPHHLWRVTHCLSHHTYTNMMIDLEITAFMPFIYFLSCQPANNKLTPYYQFLILAAAPLLLLIESLTGIIKGRPKIKITHLIFTTQLALAYVISGTHGLLSMLAAHGIVGILLGLTFPVHRSKGLWTEGDSKHSKDFAIHMLSTTADHNKNLSFVESMLRFEGFTDHAAHHMFPTVDKSKLYLLNNVIS